MAEAHYLAIGFTLGVEAGPTFGRPQGQSGQAVFEGLFKAEKFQYAQVEIPVESQASFVGANGIIELHPVSPVCSDIALVVMSAHAKAYNSVGLCHPLQNLSFTIFRMLFNKRN